MKPFFCHRIGQNGLYRGETGIRTQGTHEGTTVFETAPFNRSGISPGANQSSNKYTSMRRFFKVFRENENEKSPEDAVLRGFSELRSNVSGALVGLGFVVETGEDALDHGLIGLE